MGLMQNPVEENRQVAEEKVVKVIQSVKIPVQEAAKHFYRENPREFLHWLTTSLVLILTILVGFVRPGAWFLYFMVAVYVFCQSPVLNKSYVIIKKITKRKKQTNGHK